MNNGLKRSLTMKDIKKVVLAYSGGLDTSAILVWLQETYNCEVVAYAADVGQEEELSGLPEKAKASGATKCYVEDLREEFVSEYIFRAIKANAMYENLYLLGTSLARPLIAKKHVEIAQNEGADAVAHGATGKGNDQVRFELTFRALDPSLIIISPWRIWEFKGRTDLINYCKKKNIPCRVSAEKPYSMDRNIMHNSFEGGILENPADEPNDDIYLLTTPIEKTPDKATYTEITFEKGIPVAIDGKSYAPVALMQKLNKIGGENGIGRIDIVENRLVGMKSRGVYETPGGTILMIAHRALETITLERETYQYKDLVSQRYSVLVYNGQWFHPLRQALDAFIDHTQEKVSGTVRLKLYKGNCLVVGRQSPYSLYSEALASFEEEEMYNQADAEGFIKLYGLPMEIVGRRDH